MNLKRKMLSMAVGLSLGLSFGFAGTAFAADEVYIPLISKGFQTPILAGGKSRR